MVSELSIIELKNNKHAVKIVLFYAGITFSKRKINRNYWISDLRNSPKRFCANNLRVFILNAILIDAYTILIDAYTISFISSYLN